MGVDIHLYFEGKTEDKWILISYDPFYRNYDSFALLAGVRNYCGIKPISEPRGLPNDLSDDIKKHLDSDSFCCSWLELSDFNNYNWNNESIDSRITQINKKTGKMVKGVIVNGINNEYEDNTYIYKFMKIKACEIREKGFIKEIIKELRWIIEHYDGERVIFWFD